MLEKLLDGKYWFPVVLPLAVLVALAFVTIACRRLVRARLIVGGAFGVFVGLFIGILATGHVFAITTKMMLGFAMAIPGYGLAWLGIRSLWSSDMGASTRT
jgi:hypothetical protein